MNTKLKLFACLAVFVVAGLYLCSEIFGLELDHGAQKTTSLIDFNRDIRPILNENCTSCHGGVTKQGGVSFIFREEALNRGHSGRKIVVPGNPSASELIARVTSKDPGIRMPYKAPPLSEEKIELLKQWIDEGAHWEEHWAFVPPKTPSVPRGKEGDRVSNPIDSFILERLNREGLSFSKPASKEALLRRVSLDLIGLPPTGELLASFLADTSADAYEKQVEQLLSSERFGERWASMWLDLARYADSRGYEADRTRTSWPYRDWVIGALNDNMPYDDFVIRQLAGDLLDSPTMGDIIATTFHRLTPANDEGGTDDEEYRLIAAMDRVATTWSVLNGLTMNCVQCHSHPYDPIVHDDYYRSLAFFNSSRDADTSDEYPTLQLPKDRAIATEFFERQKTYSALRKQIVEQNRRGVERADWSVVPINVAKADELAGLKKMLDLNVHEGKNREELTALMDGLEEHQTRPMALALQNGEMMERGDIPPRVLYDFTLAPSEKNLTALRIEVPPLEPENASHTAEAGFSIAGIYLRVIRADGSEQEVPFAGFLADADDTLRQKLNFMDSTIEGRSDATLQEKSGAAVSLSSGFSTHKLFNTRWTVGILEKPLNLAPNDRLKIQLLQTQTANWNLKPVFMRRARISTNNSSEWHALVDGEARNLRLADISLIRKELSKTPSVSLPVMGELEGHENRKTRKFERGDMFNKVGDDLTGDVPEIFPSLSNNTPRNRLSLAKWFFHPEQPLTARVGVNRFWEQLFGTGLVETLEDFGSIGTVPSHPELLDWLALYFQNDLDWNIKALLRTLVTSTSYRQSADVTDLLIEKDPKNRLLARGPRQRLSAEMVRDQALLAGGLLSERMGGTPVMPPQPKGVWRSVYSSEKWVDSKGEDRFRRAIYTYIKRSSPYPSFLTFDAATRDISLARRTPTNTPLQALVTLNDPVYAQASKSLAKKMMAKAEKSSTSVARSDLQSSLNDGLNLGAQAVLSRSLSVAELTLLRETYADTAKEKNATSDLNSWTAIASILLNLDAALTR